jgi:hypothetical protein
MSIEINFDSFDFEEIDKYSRSSTSQTTSIEPVFHEAIFYKAGGAILSNRTYSLKKETSETAMKTKKVMHTNFGGISNFSGEIGGKISWGGENGVQATGYAQGSASDDKGNTAEITVEINSDGTGSASASLIREEDKDS